MAILNLKTIESYVPKLISLLEVIQGVTGAGGPIAGEALQALHAAVTAALAGDAKAGDLDAALARLRAALQSDDAAEDAELAAEFPSKAVIAAALVPGAESAK